ncbi:MAG TPA: hypothetical protein VFS20_08030 [Longimicrobium sp.]|nr:hypothetical protein [Longimicrobium sp.]
MPFHDPTPRLFLLLARAAPVAVIFRRGPSKQVEVVRWDTRTDTFERGHWIKGRIYERRSDLSPSGELLVYFASQYNRRTLGKRTGTTCAWTAVSRVPWLTALALWPKGDCWRGGGLFESERTLLLNHRPGEDEPHRDHRPRGLRVRPNPDAHGEDDPLYTRRLQRDGWRMEQPWEVVRNGYDFSTTVPEIMSRGHRSHLLRMVKERSMTNLRRRERFHVAFPYGGTLPLDGADWADWDHAGRLVVLRRGAVSAADIVNGQLQPLRELIDLTADTFEPREPPPSARRL